MVSLNNIVVWIDAFNTPSTQVELARRVESVKLLCRPEVVAELSALGLAMVFASGTFVDDGVCASSRDPVALAVGGEIEGTLVGETIFVEGAATEDELVVLGDHELTVNPEPGEDRTGV